MQPAVRFASTSDGVSIAFAVHGHGPPLVFTRGWISHLDLHWLDPDFRLFMEALGRHFTVVRYDMRGNGLSDRDVTGRLSLDELMLDLEAVLAKTDVGAATHFATCYGGPIAARFAAKHPELVTRLMLDGTYPRGADVATEIVRESVLSTVRLLASNPRAATTMLGHYTSPVASDLSDVRAERTRRAINGEVAEELYALAFALDVTDDLRAITAPTLVTHRRKSYAVRVELGQRVAALVPDAMFVASDGAAHNPWEGDATPVLAAMGEFLCAPLTDGYHPRVTVRPTVVLFSDIVDSTGMTSRIGDARARTIVRAHNAIVARCLDARGGRLVKATGDGAMAEFPSVSQAVGCAVDVQLSLAAHSAERPDEAIQVRIGINAGEPLSEDDDLHGLVVSTAARICDQGKGGDIIVSNVVRELAVGKGYAFVGLGPTALRGIGEPIELFRVEY